MSQPQNTELLKRARTRYSQREIAELLDVNIRTVRRWEARETDPPPYLADAIRQRVLPFAATDESSADTFHLRLFAIGGISGLQHTVDAASTSDGIHCPEDILRI